jgi:hypothetical protein
MSRAERMHVFKPSPSRGGLGGDGVTRTVSGCGSGKAEGRTRGIRMERSRVRCAYPGYAADRRPGARRSSRLVSHVSRLPSR